MFYPRLLLKILIIIKKDALFISDRKTHVCRIQYKNYMSIIIDCFWNNQYIHSSEELYVDLCSLTIEPNTENKALTVAIKILAYNLYGI